MDAALAPGGLSVETLWPDESVRLKRLDRYHAINAACDHPIVLHLTRRGFFSEVNVALDAALFALAERRRLVVLETRFNGLRWSDYFASDLPGADGLALDEVPLEDQLRKPKDPNFQGLLAWVRDASGPDAGFRFDELGVAGGLFEAKRALCRMFCRPAEALEDAALDAMARLGLEPGRFAAVHVRRGDKVAVRIKNGKAWSEGEDTPVEHIAGTIGRISPQTRDVLVLTDDFAAVGELAVACSGRRVVTLCPPDAAGHQQDAFNAASPEAKAEIVRRLVIECLIAARSDAFAGGFKSNVARFVTAIHLDPGRCSSTDSRAEPWLS